jgi:hypothetical protein
MQKDILAIKDDLKKINDKLKHIDGSLNIKGYAHKQLIIDQNASVNDILNRLVSLEA